MSNFKLTIKFTEMVYNKLYPNIFLWFAVSCVFISCDSRGLNPNNYNSYTNENFWESKEEVEAGLNGCYEVLRPLYGFGVSSGQFSTETISPNAYDAGANNPFVTGGLDPDNASLLRNQWKQSYKGIGRVNTVLENIGSANITQSEKDQMEGQALFLRAFFYSHLVFYYGDVPLILGTPNLEEHGSLPRNSKDEIIGQMITDLNTAIEKLPVSYDKSNTGRATRGAAMALKAKVLLYYASPLFNPENEVKRWEAAADAAEAVINIASEAGYALYPDYRKLFMEDAENNEEVIFDIQYSAPRIVNNCNVILELQQNIAPLLDLVNSYYMIDGKSAEDSPLFDPDSPYENRDSRLSRTIAVPGSMFMGKTVNTSVYNNTGFVFKKNTDYEDDVSYPNAPIRSSGLNTIVIRYADVLLMYAEAKNEIDGPGSAIFEVLNRIRDRAGMPHFDQDLDQEQLREEIRHERRIELAGEGLYYLDFRRWKIGDEVMNGPVYNSDKEVIQTRTWVDKLYMWPIPTTFIERNPALEQTPGY